MSRTSHARKPRAEARVRDLAAENTRLSLLVSKLRDGYLRTIEHTLLAVTVPSGQPAVSRAFADIFSLVKHATSEIDVGAASDNATNRQPERKP